LERNRRRKKHAEILMVYKHKLDGGRNMWTTYSNKGTKIEKDFWDWTCMYKVMTDYMEELGITEDEAYKKFWEEVRNYDTEYFDDVLWGRTLEEAVGNGYLDELRADYLYGLNIECKKTNDEI
jgi:hypothetical protein